MICDKINTLASAKIPFLFISNFDASVVEVFALDELDDADVEFCIDENYIYKKHQHEFKKEAVGFKSYEQKFNLVQEKIKSGDTYLLNLTQPTKIETELSLKEIYALANARYKLRYKDQFVCFSPESFIQIKDNTIHTFPMKGTIDSSLKNAKEIILNDEKEMAEHTMVVDLLRNDLSIIAKKVRVEQFRYIQKIDSGVKKLLQVSSHISGSLEKNWQKRFCEIIYSLLPAGSISGTPKRSTVEIIKSVEGYERGFFSGVFGFFDGESFDSGVMIRFIQKNRDGYIYKSGGGITAQSTASAEYNELLDKIYLP